MARPGRRPKRLAALRSPGKRRAPGVEASRVTHGHGASANAFPTLTDWAESARLTPAELRVVERVVRGLSNKEAATQLAVSPATVRAHLLSACKKLRVTSRGELAHLVFTVLESGHAALAEERRRLIDALEKERNLLDAVLRQSPTPIVVADAPSGRIVLANEAAIRVEPELGRAGAPADAVSLATVRHDGRKLARDEFPLVRALGGETVSERLQTASDPPALLHVEAAPIRDRKGAIVAAVAMARDVTQKARAEAALRASEARFRVMTETVPGIVFTARHGGELDYVNAQFTAYTGLSRESARGRPWILLVDSEGQWNAQAAWEHARETARFDGCYRLQSAAGQFRWFRIRGRPELDDTGGAAHWLCACTDVDDLVRAEESARTALRSREEILALITHDLRAPTENVLRMADILRGLGDDEPASRSRRLGNFIARTARSMHALLADLVTLGDLETGHAVVRPTHSDPRALVDRLVVSLAREDGVRIAVDAAPDLPLVMADEARLPAVLQAVLRRGVQASSGEPVRLSVEAREGEVVFAVTDQGPPLTPEHARRLFDRVWLMSVGTRRGFGLDFLVAKRIVEAHFGRFWVESAPGATTVAFSLPRP